MNLDNYVEVADRIAQFFTKHPEGSLTAADPLNPIRIITVGETTFLEYVCIAKRHPNDEGGHGIAWEPFPGRTPFTKDSEAMVAETSARGRAILAVMDLVNNKASKEEVLASTTKFIADNPPTHDEWTQKPVTNETPKCAHGMMKFWAAPGKPGKYYCPQPKGSFDKCEPLNA